MWADYFGDGTYMGQINTGASVGGEQHNEQTIQTTSLMGMKYVIQLSDATFPG